MPVVIDGTNGIDTPDLASTGPITGTTGTFSGGVSGTTGTFSGNVTLGSSVLATPTGSAPSYTCRAWVNFNGTGTVAIRSSGNVSSLTDYGVGAYGINFTAAMPDTNYATIATIGRTVADTAALSAWERASNKTVNNTEINSTFSTALNNGMADFEVINVSIFR